MKLEQPSAIALLNFRKNTSHFSAKVVYYAQFPQFHLTKKIQE